MEAQQQPENGRKIEIPSRVEELWERSPHLPSPQRLNAAFESILVSSFPQVPQGKVIEIASDASIAEAVEILAHNNVISAPVRDVDAPEDASWMDRYLGIAEFAGIILWLLQQTKMAASVNVAGATGAGTLTGSVAGALGAAALAVPATGMIALASAAGAAGLGAISAAGSGSEAADAFGGEFFKALTSSSFYRESKVKDIAGSFRWAPFLPVQKSDTLLTVLLLLSNYHMKSLPVVESGQAQVENLITQSAVVHVLSQCIGLPWFDSLGKLSLAKLGLPVMPPEKMVKIVEEEPVLHAFELMRSHGVGGLPVVTKSENRPVGNISVRDVRFLLTAPELYRSYRTITARDFIEVTRSYLRKDEPSSPMLKPVVVCSSNEKLQDVISKLDEARIHRIYIVDSNGNLEGVVTLRDIISKFVDEPPGYFGDFFAGVVPSPVRGKF